jgi:hypothetical protein
MADSFHRNNVTVGGYSPHGTSERYLEVKEHSN